MLIAISVIVGGLLTVLWAQAQSERDGRGGGWGGLTRTAILIGGCFAVAAVIWARTR